MKKIFITTLIIICIATIYSCGSTKSRTPQIPSGIINLAITENAPIDKYANMDYGIRLNISDARANTNLTHVYDASSISLPRFTANPEVRSFVSESMRRYMRTMGFNLDSDPSTDYMLT